MSEPITYDRKIFAENLLRLMKEQNERQVDLAELLGVSKSTVSAYCSGAQMPRMDKIEQLSRHFGVSRAALLGGDEPAPAAPAAEEAAPIVAVYRALNEAGQGELLRYGHFLTRQPDYRAEGPAPEVLSIKHYLVPAAAGYASPIEGEDYEMLPRPQDAPARADFCLTVRGDSMEPFIADGSLIYVRRDAPLEEFDVGVFFVDGDVFCKQWCVDYAGTLHLLSANPLRQDANLTVPRDAGRVCVCFGKVLLPRKLPRPGYW